MNYYEVINEYHEGYGYTDIVLRPLLNHLDKPAMVIKLKYNQSLDSAINQIKTNHYHEGLLDYYGKVLLVGINYDKESHVHECVIEEMIKLKK